VNKTLPEETAGPTEAGEVERPLGWAGTLLSQICEINPAKPSSDDLKPNEFVTFVPMPAVDADAGAITSPQEKRFSDVRKGFTAFRNGDVIMAKITPCMENGKAAIASGLTNGLGFGSTEFHVLRSTGAVLPKFVYYFIRQESFRRAAESEMTGSVGQKRVPAEFLRVSEIPLPPFAEQKRIVTKVEDLLAGVRVARASLAHVPAILKRFRQAVLAAACEGRLTEEWRQQRQRTRATAREGELPNTWKTVKSSELFEFVTTGSRGWARYYSDHGPLFLRVGNLDHNSIKLDLTSVQHVLPPRNQEAERTRVNAQDILVTVTAEVGMVAVVPEGLGDAYVNQHVAIARPSKDVNVEFLAWFLTSPEGGQRQFAELKRGATKAGLGLDDIRSLQVPQPPVVEQEEIVWRVEEMFKLADAIEKRVAAATARVEKLTQAILAKAFRGELVPTEAELARRERRSYEPATVLLERVRGERAETSKGEGRRVRASTGGAVSARAGGRRGP
jgi:type I restriction enzyme, S subunit